jgi:hypothetical protein
LTSTVQVTMPLWQCILQMLQLKKSFSKKGSKMSGLDVRLDKEDQF